uniref:Uncharacterized conserved protein, contains a C-terminal beta-barrel porin domain n=1 Tax=Candidatus Kentrum sp. LFY TaxID=2126342 RepID=A0A450WCT7_9GAMM|nr:MAG: Uncharacterized conserved protein, contains a C-terminal beta-barrel porin domain [Candidatus Kentron sp. LFY]
MNTRKEFIRSRLGKATTLACFGVMATLTMVCEDVRAAAIAVVTPTAGQNVTIGSTNSIDVTDKDGIVSNGVVVGNITVESGGVIDVDANSLMGELDGIRVFVGNGGASANAGAENITNKGTIEAKNSSEMVGIDLYADGEGPGDNVAIDITGVTNEGTITTTIDNTVSIESGKDLLAAGIGFGADTSNKGHATAKVNHVTNRSRIESSIAATGTNTDNENLESLGIIFHAAAEGGVWNAVTSVSSVTNESEGKITVTGGDSALGIAFVTEVDPAGNATINAGNVVNQGAITASGGVANTAGIVFYNETENPGNATITVDSVVNKGTIIAKDGPEDTVGINLSNETSGTGSAIMKVGSVTNEKDISATVAKTVTPSQEDLWVEGISFGSESAGAGNATATMSGDLTNRGDITSTIESDIQLTGNEELYAIGMEVYAETEDPRKAGTGDAATNVARVVNEGKITAIGAKGEGYGIAFFSETKNAGDATVTVDSVVNKGTITAKDGSKDVAGIGFSSLAEDAGSAIMKVGSVTNEKDISATVAKTVTPSQEDLWVGGISFGSESSKAGNATATISGDLTNRGNITSTIESGITVSGSEKLYALGIEVFADTDGTAQNTGDAAANVGRIVNEGKITASGGQEATAGIALYTETKTAGDTGIAVSGVVNKGTIIASGKSESIVGIDLRSKGAAGGNSTIQVSGDIINEQGASITSDKHGVAFSTTKGGAGNATITVGGTLINRGTIKSASDGHGIHVGAGTTITGGITNTGTIEGSGSTPYAIHIEDNATVSSISISGDSARLIGGVEAANSTVTLSGQSNDNYFATGGSYKVKSFGIDATGALQIADNAHSITVTNGFDNRGTLRVPAGVDGQITGNYTQAGDGAYITGIDADTGSITVGKLAVTGSVDLNDKLVVEVTAAAKDLLKTDASKRSIEGVVTYGTTSSNTDAIVVTDNSLLVDFTAKDNGTTNKRIDLTATVMDNYADALSSKDVIGNDASLSGIATALGTIFDDAKKGGRLSADMEKIVETLGKLAPAGRAKALKEVKETSTAVAVSGVAAKVGGGFSGAMQNRVAAITTPSSMMVADSGLAAGDGGVTSWWLKPYGSIGSQDNKDDIFGYDMDSRGLALGFDRDLWPKWRAGIAVSYTDTDVDSNSGTQNVDIDTYQIGVYGTRELNADSRVNVQASIGRGQYDSKRAIPTMGKVAKADYDSTNFMGALSLEKDYFKSTDSMLRATVSAEYAYVDVDGYTEDGADTLNLKISGTDQDLLILGIGGEYKHAPSEEGIFSIRGTVGYDALADKSSVRTQLAAGGAAFTTDGMAPERFLFRGGLGYELQTGNNVTIDARYDTELRKGFDDHAFSVKLEYSY